MILWHSHQMDTHLIHDTTNLKIQYIDISNNYTTSKVTPYSLPLSQNILYFHRAAYKQKNHA